MAPSATAEKLVTEGSDPADEHRADLRSAKAAKDAKEKDERYIRECEAGLHPIDPNEVSDFERWFESQPPEWIAEIDAMARAPLPPRR